MRNGYPQIVRASAVTEAPPPQIVPGFFGAAVQIAALMSEVPRPSPATMQQSDRSDGHPPHLPVNPSLVSTRLLLRGRRLRLVAQSQGRAAPCRACAQAAVDIQAMVRVQGMWGGGSTQTGGGSTQTGGGSSQTGGGSSQTLAHAGCARGRGAREGSRRGGEGS